MSNNVKLNSKNILLVMVIATAITLITGTTYAYLNLGQSANKSTGTAGCFNVTYTGQAINNENLVSSSNYFKTKKDEDGNEITDASGNPIKEITAAQTTVKLQKASDCKIYTKANIELFTNSSITAPIATYQALKYKVEKTSGNGTILSGGEGIITTKGTNTTLATVSLTDTETTYTIYIWIDSAISNGHYDGTTYSGYIYAESIQTSTVTG